MATRRSKRSNHRRREGYTERTDAVETAERVRGYLSDTDTVVVGDAAVEIYVDEGGDHRWRLRHRNGRLLAVAVDGLASRSNAVDNVTSLKRRFPNAPTDNGSAHDD